MPSVKHNSITAKAIDLIFHCSTLLQPKWCLLAYRSICNVFFRDLPVSSFMFHSSLLTVKSVDLVVARDGFLCVTKIKNHLYFSWWFPWLQRCFSNISWFMLLCNELNIADREGQWIFRFLTIIGAHGTIVFSQWLLWLQAYFSNSF